jgi:hypothetical protein
MAETSMHVLGGEYRFAQFGNYTIRIHVSTGESWVLLQQAKTYTWVKIEVAK